MAEPVIFGGSPLDQYLHEANQSEHASEPNDYNRGSATPEPISSRLEEHNSSTPPHRSTARPGAKPESSASTPTAAPLTDPVSQQRAPQLIQAGGTAEPAQSPTLSCPATEQQKRSSPGLQQASPAELVIRLASTVLALALQMLRPMITILARHVSGPRPTSMLTDAGGPGPSDSQQSNAVYDSADGTQTSFIEKFKYAICSSFLLTPTLSISFYESSPPFQTQLNDGAPLTKSDRISDRVQGRRCRTSPISKQCYIGPADAPPTYGPDRTDADFERLPRLDSAGRLARNVATLSIFFLLPPISASWRLWFSSLCLIACLASAFVILLGHSSMDDKIVFTLSHPSHVDPARSPFSLRNLSTTQVFGRLERPALQGAVLKDIVSLIKSAQRFDISINKAISAIQEVEIVSRGYKLTHPLPPISRIEAASSWSNAASPARQRRSLAASPAPSNGKLGRSLSNGGNGAPTVRRHTQRPLSLNLSNGRMSPLDRPSGRASPAVATELGDLDLAQKSLMEQNTSILATARPAPQRLVELRKTIIAALDSVGATFASTDEPLREMVDAEELALLHDLYALDDMPREEVQGAGGDASLAWSHGDVSGVSESSHDVEQDRKAWFATTPRNFGSSARSAGADGHDNTPGRLDFSPQVGSTNHKRLSLVSDAGSILDRHPRTHSRRSSLVSESGNVSHHRSPRLRYVSDKVAGASGPNESASAKRLSYVSNSNSSAASPVMRNASALSSTFSPPHSSAQTYSAATSPQSRATKRSSIVGPNSIFSQVDASTPYLNRTESADLLSLLSIKAKFEWMHAARRRWLCHLLALNLKMDAQVDLPNGRSLPCDEYWTLARSSIASARSALQAHRRTVADTITKEMGPDLVSTSKARALESARSVSRDGLLTAPNGDTSTQSIIGHPGIEDRLHAMMLSLRSLQSKIQVCAEEIRVTPPPGLHGNVDEHLARAADARDDADATLQLETMLESMREDFLGLSAEWEATTQLVRKEKRRSPSPQPSTENEVDVSRSNAARELESPLEADEDAADPSLGSDHGGQAFSDGLLPRSASRSGHGELIDASDDEDDSDLAALLLNSTSPNSLPPPGLEQVFESIAGMAGLSGHAAGGSKLSRAQRIELQREQRELEKQANGKASHRHRMDPTGMMSELNDVITSRKVVRDQRHDSALPFGAATAEATTMQRGYSAPSLDGVPALALGSPLDLGTAGETGTFGGSHSFGHAQPALARRSLSSLDLARARALQALEARPASSASSNSFDSGDESMSRHSEEFSFERTALESVPENETGAGMADSVGVWESGSRKSTPKASAAALEVDATPVPDSPFDLGAQVAAYARRQRAAKRAALQASGSESSVGEQLE
ncbi:Vezatin domain-containing protein [Pseudozyma hubeiensis]|nr:Vezatin domain-containing protein [Pseudozyma hubeiensis]